MVLAGVGAPEAKMPPTPLDWLDLLGRLVRLPSVDPPPTLFLEPAGPTVVGSIFHLAPARPALAPPPPHALRAFHGMPC